LELPRGSEMRVKKRQKYGGEGGFHKPLWDGNSLRDES